MILKRGTEHLISKVPNFILDIEIRRSRSVSTQEFRWHIFYISFRNLDCIFCLIEKLFKVSFILEVYARRMQAFLY